MEKSCYNCKYIGTKTCPHPNVGDTLVQLCDNWANDMFSAGRAEALAEVEKVMGELVCFYTQGPAGLMFMLNGEDINKAIAALKEKP